MFVDWTMLMFCLCSDMISERSFFVLFCHGHRVALSDVDVLYNYVK